MIMKRLNQGTGFTAGEKEAVAAMFRAVRAIAK